MIIGIAIAVVIGLGVGALLLSRVSVGKSRLQVIRKESHFPVVSGYSLEREEFEFPADFGGEYNLVIVPFQRLQQQDVNTWIPAARELERTYPGLVYYELPTIYELPTLSRTFINEGMRAGIPDQTARERTITLYLDKDTFKTALEIESEETIHLFLVDRQGNILWREQGVFRKEKLDGLLSVLEEELG